MAIMVWPINNVTYDGDDVRGGYAPRGSGVYAMDTHFPVSISGNQVTIGTGSAWMQLDKLKGLTFQVETPETIALPALTVTQVARIFLHAEVNNPGNNSIVVRTGTSSTDSEINPVQNTSVFELAPYEFIYQGGSYVLIDNRGNERLCGLMRDEVTKLVGTQQIIDEGNATIASLTAQSERLRQIINDIEGGNPYMLKSAYDLNNVVNDAGGISEYAVAKDTQGWALIEGMNDVTSGAYYRIQGNTVGLRGAFLNVPSDNTVCGILPSEARPSDSTRHISCVYPDGTTQLLYVYPDGSLNASILNGKTGIQIDGTYMI